jgi:hypothetical protein
MPLGRRQITSLLRISLSETFANALAQMERRLGFGRRGNARSVRTTKFRPRLTAKHCSSVSGVEQEAPGRERSRSMSADAIRPRCC